MPSAATRDWSCRGLPCETLERPAVVVSPLKARCRTLSCPGGICFRYSIHSKESILESSVHSKFDGTPFEQAWSSASPRRQRRTGKNGGKWLKNHLWCPNNRSG